MANAERPMPGHVEAAYEESVDNVLYLRKQQWMATNYALVIYAAVFVISAHYFSRTDAARNWLGIITIVTFLVHWYMLNSYQGAIDKFRNRLVWIYRTYFTGEERTGLDFQLEPRSNWYQPDGYIGLLAVSFIGAILTAIFLWSVR